MKELIISTLIYAGITWIILLPFTLYVNYRLDRLIKILDAAIVDRPV